MKWGDSRLTTLIKLAPRLAGFAHAPNGGGRPPGRQPSTVYPVGFDPADGKKRVVIVVNAEGGFEPPVWFGMAATRDDNGLHEAATIVAHAGLIMAEALWAHAASPPRTLHSAQRAPAQPSRAEDADGE